MIKSPAAPQDPPSLEAAPRPAKAERTARKAAERAERTARKDAAKAERKARKDAAKAERKARKDAAKAAAKAVVRAEKQAARAARKAAKAARRSAKEATKAAKSAIRAAASVELGEAAILLRRVVEPPIAPGLTERSESESSDVMPQPAEPDPAAAPAVEPVPTAELEPAAGVAEPASTAEPEPEPEPGSIANPTPTAAPGTTEPAAPEPSASAAPEPPPPAVSAPPVEVTGGGSVTVGASVDVGANSVHLLVAAVGGHRLEPLVDESVFLGLGDRIDAEGFLGSAARGRLVAALVGYADTARRLGATAITFVGTEPMRRAADAATVTAEVEHASGVPLHVLGHDEEGILNLLGVTGGRPVTHELVVVDIGGGSSEVVVVGPGRPPVAAGVLLGSARLTQRLVREDPPTPGELDALAAEARRIVAAEAPPGRPLELVAVGGTASNLCKVIPAAALERVLTRRRIEQALAMLATEPSAMASERHAVNPTRARILPAGAAIAAALLDHYGVDRLRVSEEGIREGAILVAAAAGHAWRDRLPRLALGWRHAGAPGGSAG